MRGPSLAVVFLAVAGIAGPAPAECGLPELPGVKMVHEGKASINLTPVRFVVGAPATREGLAPGPAALDRLARKAGWKRECCEQGLPTARGEMALRRYRSGKCYLMQGLLPSSKMVLQALFDGIPEWAGKEGEVPGRDPAGIPRFGGSVRTLHVSGPGYEAAFYRADVRPRNLLAEAVERLGSGGWKARVMGGGTWITATRPGRPEAMIMLRADGGKTVYIVMVTEEGI